MCVVVGLEGDVECNAWMVSHGTVQRMMCRSNPLWYALVHGMQHVCGNGRGGWWYDTHMVIGTLSQHGTVLPP